MTIASRNLGSLALSKLFGDQLVVSRRSPTGGSALKGRG